MKKHTLLFVLVILILFSCKKDKEGETILSDPFANIEIETQTPTNISNSAAQITSDLQNLNLADVSTFGHVWSSSQNPTTDLSTKTEFTNLDEGSSFTSELVGLKLNTTYYVRPYFTTSSKEVYYGEEISFTTANEFFKFIVGPDYLISSSTETERLWAIIYDSSNELIDYLELSNNETYEIDWPENNNNNLFHVHFLSLDYRHDDFGEDKSYTLLAYPDIEPRTFEKVNLNLSTDSIGTLTVDVSGMGPSGTCDGLMETQYKSKLMYNGTNIIDQYLNPDVLWVKYRDYDNEAPYFKYFPEVTQGDSIILNINELEQMSDKVSIRFPADKYNFVWIETANDPLTPDVWEYFQVFYSFNYNSYYADYYYPGEVFDDYFYYFLCHMDYSSNYFIQNKGNHPTSFIAIDATHEVLNESVTNFSSKLNVSSDIDYTLLSWVHENDKNNSFKYSVAFSLKEDYNYLAPQIPEQLINMDSEILDLSNLDFSHIQIRDMSLLNGFDEYLHLFSDYYGGNEEYIVLDKYIYHSMKNQEKLEQENTAFKIRNQQESTKVY